MIMCIQGWIFMGLAFVLAVAISIVIVLDKLK